MLVEAAELPEKLESPDTILLCSLLPLVGGTPDLEPPPEFIPNSVVFDIENFSSSEAPFPHTLMTIEEFQARARDLGINQDSVLYVYDQFGIYSSPRAWFNLLLMGCNVTLVNGGLPAWKLLGLPLSKAPLTDITPGNFEAAAKPGMVVSKEYVLQAIEEPKTRIIDVRSAARFTGIDPEPREGIRRGHVPGSINIPFPTLIDNNRYLAANELQDIFQHAGCFKDEELIFTCGSGVTACIGYFAARLCGYKNIRVYDGSWAEWGSLEDMPLEI